MQTDSSRLFSPLPLRGVELPNRVVISPMCTYSAEDGLANDWHLAHLGKFALGGAGTVFVEATGVEARGRITHGCTGIWSDEHGRALARLAGFLRDHGAVPAIQLAHAGRKASMQRPWHGNGPLNEDDFARGDEPWEIIGPTDEPAGEGWLVPRAMDTTDIAEVVQAFADGARRALDAGFEIAEIHGAHGYLLHSFLSPVSNTRRDGYGGDRQGRMRLALEVTEAVRDVWPQDKPLFFRVSAVDGLEDGWSIEDSVVLARELKARGVDVVDCSSGGIMGQVKKAMIPRGLGFQVAFARQIREEAGIATQCVGLILDGPQAEAILRGGGADLVAIGREALVDPFWAHHAAQSLGVDQGGFEAWPEQYGWWLKRRARALEKL
ncbi:NADH:flavin oxidoreductase/NADH oxidase [Ectothiorhodospiraceae bacterium WFHF3C12]|nr:NADH:flavin oxidoreductase/NADH oxidase [Ectothiorhodospiraceae bacterium WFHF3C12]